MFKKINTYLIENHPNIWHIRVPFLLITGLALHIFAFFYAYVYITPVVLAKGYYSNFMYESYFIFIQIILLLVVFFIWLLQYFKNSVIKHYYKAEKLYAVKQYLLLAFLFFWNITSFVSFDYGIDTKNNQLKEKFQVKNLKKEMTFLSPLLLVDSEDYSLYQNNFLHENQIEHIKLNGEETKIYECTLEELKNMHEAYDRSSCFTLIDSIDTANYSLVDSIPTLFYVKKSYEVSKNCYESYIERYIKLDTFHWYDIKNHHNYSSELDQLLKAKKYDVLATRMAAYTKHLNSIYDFTNINPWVNLSYIEKKNGLGLEALTKELYLYAQIDAYENLQNMNPNMDVLQLEDDEKFYFYFQNSELQSFINNVEEKPRYYQTIVSLVITSLIFAYFFIQFQFINIISFAITIPIAGVLFVIGIIWTLVLFGYGSPENGILLYVSALLITAVVIFWASSSLKERFKEILMLCIAVLIPIVVLVTYGIISSKIFKEKYISEDCYSYGQDYYAFREPPYFEWHFILLGIASVITYLLLVKRLKSKPE